MLPSYSGGLKPPLSQSTQQPSPFGNYDTGQPATTTAMNMEMPQMNDIAIVQTIPNNESEISEIACIILSGETGHLRENQSFSVNFSVHVCPRPLSRQTNTLHQRRQLYVSWSSMFGTRCMVD